MTDAISRIVQQFVRFVLNPRLPAGCQEFAQIGPPDVEQRPDDRAALRVDSAQSGEAGAPNQLEQERLRLVIARMTDGDPISPGIGGGTMQEGIPGLARGILERQPL